MFHRMAVVIFTIMLGGCSAGITAIDKSYKLQNDGNDAVAIIRILPKDADKVPSLLQFRKLGLDEKGLYNRPFLGDDSNLSTIQPAGDGYFIFRVELVSESVANRLSVIQEQSKSTNKKRIAHAAGCGGQDFAFQVMEPGLHYLGDFSYAETVSPIGEVKFTYDVKVDENALNKFLSENYPNLDTTNIKHSLVKEYWNRSTCAPQTIYVSI